ncbi:hypothetical protein T01_5812 [Trichinella spiralis]|uniref:Uncharacterized protein n=1 Tax=Trichinella spiralis TaxID=6334 RepID=A0A0V1BUF5_TRISP|nr:hypothetical protein T01_5812 [Trichinella spiralis]
MPAQRNAPVDTGPSSPSDGCDNNPVGVTNEPARETVGVCPGNGVEGSRNRLLWPTSAVSPDMDRSE